MCWSAVVAHVSIRGQPAFRVFGDSITVGWRIRPIGGGSVTIEQRWPGAIVEMDDREGQCEEEGWVRGGLGTRRAGWEREGWREGAA